MGGVGGVGLLELTTVDKWNQMIEQPPANQTNLTSLRDTFRASRTQLYLAR